MSDSFDLLLGHLARSVAEGLDDANDANLAVAGQARLPSAFAVSDLAAASMANAAIAVRRVAALVGGDPVAEIQINLRRAGLWFSRTIEPIGWTLPAVWDSIGGIYPCGERSVRLHTNAPHHRAAALETLGCEATRESVAAAVDSWDAFALEDAVVAAGGVAAALRSREEWVSHPQGAALQHEPLVQRERVEPSAALAVVSRPNRPLDGVRVLDLTRVLAGPVATRLLAGLGADVLRIDPPVWDESGLAVEVNLGKRCARLDLRDHDDRRRFEELLYEADIIVHGYRRDALERLGYGADARRAINPALVDVSLDAWGHSGPWRDRRGFDSIVQIAAGVAHRGMVAYGAREPRPLPVQALDHATGYTLAACALHGWADRIEFGDGSTWRTSLAAHAELLWLEDTASDLHADFASLGPDDLDVDEDTSWGPVRRVAPPISIAGVDLAWPNGAADHGVDAATWRT